MVGRILRQPPKISLVDQLVKNPPTMWKTWVQSLGWEDPLEKGQGTHSSILAWRIPWTVQFQGRKEPDTRERLSLSLSKTPSHVLLRVALAHGPHLFYGLSPSMRNSGSQDSLQDQTGSLANTHIKTYQSLSPVAFSIMTGLLRRLFSKHLNAL